mmetsp:Transcript_39558/g.63441  ORF Transcript_39558/g.63441 Transcript_39558/m.63441 type:complete len:384 (+) Transcript_39558:908-2059(+)
MAMPSSTLSACAAAAIATPALSIRQSATGPFSPPNASISICALSLASPPARSDSAHSGMPTSRGLKLYDLVPAGVTSTTCVGPHGVISSKLSEPTVEHTTNAFFMPSFMSESAMRCCRSGVYTPTSAYLDLAGLSMGPRRLKAVRTLSALRTGPTAAMEGWYRGAYMNPMPTSCTHCATPSGPRSTATPSASSTSADPHSDETERFPCFATLAPAAAARMHEPVEMLTVPASSPPVPTMSNTSSPAKTCTERACIALAMPAISAAVSPLARRSTRKAEICAGSASSSASRDASVSASVRSSPSHSRSISRRRSTARHATRSPRRLLPEEAERGEAPMLLVPRAVVVEAEEDGLRAERRGATARAHAEEQAATEAMIGRAECIL